MFQAALEGRVGQEAADADMENVDLAPDGKPEAESCEIRLALGRFDAMDPGAEEPKWTTQIATVFVSGARSVCIGESCMYILYTYLHLFVEAV